MCAIVDADSTGEIAAATASPAARAFKESIAAGQCRLVVGGTRLRTELARSFTAPERAKPTTVSEWVLEVDRAGQLVNCDDDTVDARAEAVEQSGLCVSEDFHIIALAQVASARMLYSKDKELHQDFTNPALLDQPRGKVYPLNLSLSGSKSWLSRNRRLCN